MLQFVKYFSLIVLISLAGCSPIVTKHGNKIEQKDLQKLRLNATRQILVPEIVGPPTLIGQVADQERWYYVSYQRQKYPMKFPTFASHDIIELSFAEQRLVNIKKYDLADMQQVVFVPNQTYRDTKAPSFWKQLLNNIGRFDGVSDI